MISRALPMAFILAIPMAAGASEGLVEAGAPAFDFVLEDANENEVALKKLRGQTVLLIVVPEGDSKEARQKHFKATKKWIRPLVEKYRERATVLGLVKLDVSFFVKGMARKEMRKNQSIRIAIDWDGDVFSHYGRSSPTVVLIDDKGQVRTVVTGHFSESAAGGLYATVDALLSE